MRFPFASLNRLVLVSLVFFSGASMVQGATEWLERWDSAELRRYFPSANGDTFIPADRGYWYLSDTVSNDPNCGADPQMAMIVYYGIPNKALFLFSDESEMGCADNVWVDFMDWGNLNSGFSIPITSSTTISFDETGVLLDPMASIGYSGLCFLPPCFDSVHLDLTDNRGNIVIYVLQRHPEAREDVDNPYYGARYREVFLDRAGGRFTRNVLEDFEALSAFDRDGAQITSVAFEVDQHGWAILDNLFIRDTGAAPPPPPDPGPADIDWIGMASSKAFQVGVPENGTPWSFNMWVTFANRDAVGYIDLFKPHASVPFDRIHWDGDDEWDWESDSKYSSLASLQADYPLGTYTLEFRSPSGELLRSVSLDYNDLPTEPTQPVHFTYPSTDHQTDVSTNPTITWTVNPSSGDALMLGLHNYTDEGSGDDDRIVAPVPMNTNSWQAGPLLGNHEYNV